MRWSCCCDPGVTLDWIFMVATAAASLKKLWVGIEKLMRKLASRAGLPGARNYPIRASAWRSTVSASPGSSGSCAATCKGLTAVRTSALPAPLDHPVVLPPTGD